MVLHLISRESFAQESSPVPTDRKLEALPILSYDTDAGMGYGVKSFFLNFLGRNESFDCVLFNSTNGERWYKIVVSVPDFELRQGKAYPLAVDFTIDYDKWVSHKFFGVGNRSLSEDQESYAREPLELSLMFGRSFTGRVVGQVGLRYKMVRNSDFENGSKLVKLLPVENAGRIDYVSLQASFRFDTRNSFINPSQGVVLQAEMEHSPGWSMNAVAFTRYQFTAQSYVAPIHPGIILAARGSLHCIQGTNIPVQVLLPIGGASTLRGLPQDRYLDKVAGLLNVELRFPLVWRFGGVVGFDAGKVWDDLGQMDLKRWSSSPVVGLRCYLDTFIARLDVGFGKETTGFYLNFGQLF